MKRKEKYPQINGIRDSRQVAVVRDIFSTIHRRYDFLNHLFSLRQDAFWRRWAASRMRFFRTYRYLDVATGTGDLAIEAALNHRGIRVAALDFVQEMMDVGRDKISRNRLSEVVSLIMGDALALPFDSESFDAAGIAFGIRNIPDKVSALREMGRVVVPGGKVLVLEMALPQVPLFRTLYDLYLNRIMPTLAKLCSPNPEAYRYLGDSIMNFPSPDEVVRLMRTAGLVDIEARSLTLGIVHVYVGLKPDRQTLLGEAYT